MDERSGLNRHVVGPRIVLMSSRTGRVIIRVAAVQTILPLLCRCMKVDYLHVKEIDSGFCYKKCENVLRNYRARGCWITVSGTHGMISLWGFFFLFSSLPHPHRASLPQENVTRAI